MRGVGWEPMSHRATLHAGRAPARSGVAYPKNVQRQYLTCPSDSSKPELRDRSCSADLLSTMSIGAPSRVADPSSEKDGLKSAGAGRDALPRVRRCTSRRFFLLLLRTRSCAIGAEALSYRLNEVFAFLGRAMPDRAGARPYQLDVRHRIARQRVPTIATAKAGAFAYHISDRRSLSRVTGHWPGTTAAPSEP